MRLAVIKISDKLFLDAFKLDKETIFLGARRADSCDATEFTLSNPNLPDLIEGSLPPPIGLEDVQNEMVTIITL